MPGGRRVLGAVERARIRHALTPADRAALVLHVDENRFPARHAAETRFKRPHQRQSYEREPDRREAHHCMVAFLRVDFRYLAIEGPPGLGKTVLAERLAARLDATVVRDDTENPFLADFYAGRSGSGFQTQLFYTLARHRRLQQLRQGDLFSQTTICDFVFERDRIYAFANLDDNELFIYQRLYDLVARDLPQPDLVVYLQAPVDLLKRLQRERANARKPTRPCRRRVPGGNRRGLQPLLLSLHRDAAARRRSVAAGSRLGRRDHRGPGPSN
jgi:thymidylate kinase